MGNRRSATISTLLGTLASASVVALQSLLLIPLFLRFIAEKVFGAWLAAGDLLVWMQAFDLGLPNLMIQKVGEAHGRKDEAGVIAWFQSCFLILFTLALAMAGFVFFLSAWVPGWLNLEGSAAVEITTSMRVAAMAVGGSMLSNAIVGYARGIQNTKMISICSTISMLFGALVTIGFLFSGFGVISIALGMAARALVILIAGWIFMRGQRVFYAPICIATPYLKESLHTVPLMAIGGIGFMLANQGELVIIGKFLSTDFAIIYMLTRRLADLTRTIIDSVTWSLFGAIAHFASSSDRPRFWGIFQDLVLLRRCMAIYCTSIFIVLNPVFVQLWAGSAKFGGRTLTLFIGIQVVLATESFFMNYAFKALGALKSTSLFLLLEGALRVGLAVALMPALGVFSIPISAIATSLTFATVQSRLISKEFSSQVSRPFEFRILGGFVVMFMVAGLTTMLYSRLTLIAYLGCSGILAAVMLGSGFLLLCKHQSLVTLMPSRFRAAI